MMSFPDPFNGYHKMKHNSAITRQNQLEFWYQKEDVPEEGTTSPDSEVKLALPAQKFKFGWIKGVLIPCLLNIWGVILYLRLPWLTGQAGIGLMSIIILLAAVVTTITTLSMSAICTNGEVKGGGAYYLISRSLGPEFGGSIGIIFSLANAVGVALYVVGFGETVQELMEKHGAQIVDKVNDVRIIGLITVILLLLITLIGLEWVVRAQLLLLGVLLISMAAYILGTIFGPLTVKPEVIKAQGYTGYSASTFLSNFGPEFRGKEDFFRVFSIFFPAATGILAGVNISGDLKDPQIAVPKGTLSAIVLTTVVYIGMAWMIGGCTLKDAPGYIAPVLMNTNSSLRNLTAVSNFSKIINNTSSKALPTCEVTQTCKYGLLNDYQIMEKMALYGPLILAGIFAATLSSALASLVGSPKTFQAVCRDGIFKGLEFFGRGDGPNDEPRRAYVLTFLIGAGFTAIGKLNIIAPIISNFFLMSYALINYSVFAASLSKSPGWRPSFTYYNMWLSLFGCGLCIAIMFIVKWWAALVTIVVIMGLYKFVDYKKPEINWGSSGQAHTYRKALRLAHTLNRIDDHVKNFRPQCLVLTGLPSSRPDLVHFASYLTKHVGLMICGQINISKEGLDLPTVNQDKWLRHNKIKAFHLSMSSPSLRVGFQSIVQCAGLGKLKPNILVIGYKDNWQKQDVQNIEEYVDIIHDAFDYKCGVAILRMPKGVSIEDEEDSDNSIESDDEYENQNQAERRKLTPNKTEESSDAELKGSYADTPMIQRNTENNQNAKNTTTDSIKTENDAKKYEPESLPPSLTEKKKGNIDVWWLFDDGGLTVLLPYLLQRSKVWRDCAMRVFTPGGGSRMLKSNQVRMASLLKKFRIDFSDIVEVSGINRRPTDESIKAFCNLRIKDELSASEALDKKTLRQIRLGELLQEHSHNAKLIVLNLPIPRKQSVTPIMYMSWLETLSTKLPPVLFVRGNQMSVLTFYS